MVNEEEPIVTNEDEFIRGGADGEDATAVADAPTVEPTLEDS